MKKATVILKSISPYSQSRAYDVPKKEKENHGDYEERTWRNRCHTDKDGMVYIPAMAFKNCLSEAAKYLGIQIPGKGKSTYTKHFEAGLQVVDNVPLGIHIDAIQGEKLFVPSDGIRGSGKRVFKTFPYIPDWKASIEFYIWDDTITEKAFVEHLDGAGKFIGIGRFRPRNNGLYGRFVIEKITWDK